MSPPTYPAEITVVELVNRADSDYFIQNPTVEWFTRSFVEGEVDRDVLIAAGVDPTRVAYVEVCLIAPGIRARTFLVRREPDAALLGYVA